MLHQRKCVFWINAKLNHVLYNYIHPVIVSLLPIITMDALTEQLAALKMIELKTFAKERNLRGFSKYTTKATLQQFILSSNVANPEVEATETTVPIVGGEGVTPSQDRLSHVKVLDLFCGCGGMTNGFDKRFEVVCGIDVWDKAVESYNSNYDHEGVCRDLTVYTPKQCDDELIHGATIDIIVGGPPCQAYSMGGKRDPNDPRSNLFMEYYAYLQYFKPKVFIMENVMGILSVKDTNRNLLINRIMELLSENYNCVINRLFACDFEVPQLRRRVIIMGIRKDLNTIPTPIATINPDSRIAVGTVLQERKDIDPSQFLSERAITGINAKRERMQLQSKGFGAQFLDLQKPSYTIPARYWKDGYDALVTYYDTEIRRLTVLELKRIQTFPDDYVLCGSKKDQITQIGNAVACRFAYHVASHVANALQWATNCWRNVTDLYFLLAILICINKYYSEVYNVIV